MNDNLTARLRQRFLPWLEPIMIGIAMTVPGVPMRTEFPRVGKSVEDARADDSRAVQSDVRRSG